MLLNEPYCTINDHFTNSTNERNIELFIYSILLVDNCYDVNRSQFTKCSVRLCQIRAGFHRLLVHNPNDSIDLQHTRIKLVINLIRIYTWKSIEFPYHPVSSLDCLQYNRAIFYLHRPQRRHQYSAIFHNSGSHHRATRCVECRHQWNLQYCREGDAIEQPIL